MNAPVFQNILYTLEPGVDVLSRTKNGHVKTIGVELYAGNEEIQLTPIRSNGATAQGGSLGVARNKDSLRALATALNDLADTL